MSTEEIHELKSHVLELQRAFKVSKRSWQSWLHIILSGVLAVLTSILIPWGTWVTNQIHTQDRKLVQLEDWKSIDPRRFTTADAENMKFRILAESAQQFGTEIGKLSGKIESLNVQIIELKTLFAAHATLEKDKP